MHRPFLASAPQSREAIERQVPLMLQNLKEYVQEMGITDRFYQEMVNTEPSALTFYRGEEIQILVPKKDPIEEELDMARNARAHGVDTSVMRLRQQAADQCPPVNGYNICQWAKLYGIDERLAEQRLEDAIGQCYFTRADRDALWLVKKRDRPNDPIMIRHEECQRRYMLGQ